MRNVKQSLKLKLRSKSITISHTKISLIIVKTQVCCPVNQRHYTVWANNSLLNYRTPSGAIDMHSCSRLALLTKYLNKHWPVYNSETDWSNDCRENVWHLYIHTKTGKIRLDKMQPLIFMQKWATIRTKRMFTQAGYVCRTKHGIHL